MTNGNPPHPPTTGQAAWLAPAVILSIVGSLGSAIYMFAVLKTRVDHIEPGQHDDDTLRPLLKKLLEESKVVLQRAEETLGATERKVAELKALESRLAEHGTPPPSDWRDRASGVCAAIEGGSEVFQRGAEGTGAGHWASNIRWHDAVTAVVDAYRHANTTMAPQELGGLIATLQSEVAKLPQEPPQNHPNMGAEWKDAADRIIAAVRAIKALCGC